VIRIGPRREEEAEEEPPPKESQPSGARWVGGALLGGAGLAGLGVGIWLGVDAQAKFDKSKETCDVYNKTTYCKPEGIELRATSRQTATIATMALLGGAGAAIGGIFMLSRAASPGKPADPSLEISSVVVGPGSISLVGRW